MIPDLLNAFMTTGGLDYWRSTSICVPQSESITKQWRPFHCITLTYGYQCVFVERARFFNYYYNSTACIIGDVDLVRVLPRLDPCRSKTFFIIALECKGVIFMCLERIQCDLCWMVFEAIKRMTTFFNNVHFWNYQFTTNLGSATWIKKTEFKDIFKIR